MMVMPCTYGHGDNVVYSWIPADNLLRVQTQATGVERTMTLTATAYDCALTQNVFARCGTKLSAPQSIS